MTNFEWIRSLTMEELSNIFFGSRCSTCAYKARVACPTDKNGCCDCKGGFAKWVRQERKPTFRVNWCIHRGGHFDIEADSDEEAMQIVQKEKFSEILTDIKNDISLSIDTGE